MALMDTNKYGSHRQEYDRRQKKTMENEDRYAMDILYGALKTTIPKVEVKTNKVECVCSMHSNFLMMSLMAT